MATNNLIVCSYLDLKIKSEHPIAQAIVRKATEKSIPTLKVSEFNSLTGHGVVASYFEKMTFVGNHRKTNNQMIGSQNLSGRLPIWSQKVKM
jgi:cation transport ATPase